MIKVISTRIPNEIDSKLLNRLLKITSLRKPFLRYRKKVAYLSWIGDLIVRWYISKKNRTYPSKIIFLRNIYGKPYLGIPYGYHFNISHSENIVVVAFNHKPVGIDVELINNDLKVLDISKRFFSNSGNEAINRSTNKLDLFYDLWTLKESYVKFVGLGFALNFKDFSINFSEETITVSENGKELPQYFKKYLVNESYKVSVCGTEPIYSEITEISFCKMCEELLA